MKLAGRWRNVERRGPRTHIRGQLMATIADSSPLTESTLLRALIAVWVLFDAYPWLEPPRLVAKTFRCLAATLLFAGRLAPGHNPSSTRYIG